MGYVIIGNVLGISYGFLWIPMDSYGILNPDRSPTWPIAANLHRSHRWRRSRWDLNGNLNENWGFTSAGWFKKLWKINENHHFFHGKIHYFDWAIFNCFLYVHQRVYIWVCLKMLAKPRKTQWFCWSDNPVLKWLAIIGNINPTFSDKLTSAGWFTIV